MGVNGEVLSSKCLVLSGEAPRPEGAMAVHYSSQTDEWETPRYLFAALDREFGFTLDVCATAVNAKCGRFFTPEEDGLKQEWSGVVWMNPPYGRVIGHWMRRAHHAAIAGATVVCLVPSRTDTAWFHDFAMPHEIRLLRGRLKFNGTKDAPFPSAVVVMRPANHRLGAMEVRA